METVVQYQLERCHMAFEHLIRSRPLREPHRLVENLQQQVDDLVLQLEKGWENSSQERARRLQSAERALARLNPRVRWQRLYTHLNTLERRFETAARSRLTLRWETLSGISNTLHSLSPLAVLGRGYSLCRDPATQQLIPNTTRVHNGQRIEVLLQDGQLICTVDDIHQKEPNHGRLDFRASFETS
jgi:exodeoxyribonuclease VII large subunit